MELWSCWKMAEVGGTNGESLFNKALHENEKCVLYFYFLKTKGTFWSTHISKPNPAIYLRVI